MKKLILLAPTLAMAGNIEVAFSPSYHSLELVLKVINSSKYSICMASYSFTSLPIAKSLLSAKMRGVNIKIVADKRANDNKYTAIRYLANQGLTIRLNDRYPIMHNKFIVVDNHSVETGSYNYSNAAATRNAENVIVMWGYPQIATKYANECNYLFNEGVTIGKSY